MAVSTLELTQLRSDARGLTGPDSGLSVSITLLRGAATLPAQHVRLYGAGAGTASGEGTESAQTSIRVIGAPDMDIRARDRFTVGGLAYEVVAVLPQRQVATWAQVRSLQ